MRTADLILDADRIYTLDPRRPVVRSLAVVGDRIAAIGTRASMRSWKGRSTEVLHFPGRVVVPGLIDCHAHLFAYALMADEVDLARVASMPAVLKKLAAAAQRRGRGIWLVGNGFDKSLTGGDFPTSHDLDAATGPATPACVFSRDCHYAWLNTPALKALRISKATPDPTGGQILRDHRGHPTGILLDKAMEVLNVVRAAVPEASVRRLWRRVCREAWSYGITGIHSVDEIDAFGWFQRFRADGTLGLRVRYAFPLDRLRDLEQLRVQSGLGDDWLRGAAVKIFSDGALGSQTAWMFDPYPSRPEYYGIPVCFGQVLHEAVQRAVAAGLACWIHAIGDRAVHEVATALAHVASRRPRLLHRIEHAQCTRPDTMRLMASNHVIASVQPSHLCEDIRVADTHWPAVTQFAFPLRSFRKAGVPLAFGSDAPVETLNPYLGMYAAVARSDRRGEPADGWHPGQRLGRLAALAGYTRSAARSVGDQDHLGRLVEGAYADLAVLSEDPFRCAVRALPAIRSVCTVVGGVLRYSV